MRNRNRIHSTHIWGLAFGYFLFYVPYSAMIKAVTSGAQPIAGVELLAAASATTALAMLSIITLADWWKYAGRRTLLGVRVAFPSRWTALSGLATAVIIVTTGLAYSFSGVSILLALLLLRGGVLIIGPIVDLLFKHRVRWFSWSALALSMLGLAVAFADVGNYDITWMAGLNIAAYLAGYAVRLSCMNSVAKSRDETATRRYFVEEQLAAAFVLIAVGLLTPMGDERAVVAGTTIGFLYAALCFFGTQIYLDARENTFCIPLNRCSSLLSGLVAAYALSALLDYAAPSMYQLTAAGMVGLGLLFLSPLHHVRSSRARIRELLSARPLVSVSALIGARSALRRPGATRDGTLALKRIFLFVCGGNTFRSPIAQAICTDEIARRLGISREELARRGILVISAGLNAQTGATMKPEAERALARLSVWAPHHSARQLTHQLIEQADAIYCMTDAQRRAAVEMSPDAASKIERLDPDRDLEEPVSEESSLRFVEQVRELVQRRITQRSALGMESV
jgi:protein-tyrosine-phosphatase